MARKKLVFFLFAWGFAFLLIVKCTTYPVDTSGKNILEMESVWQYLCTYSIWQEKVPLEPFALDSLNTPEEILLSVWDTFHTVNYTCYDSTILPKNSKSLSISETTVYFYRLTLNTAYLRITEFIKDTTLFEFKNILESIKSFSNIILDLRQNGGGDLRTIDSLMEYFLPVNTPYIYAKYRKYDSSKRKAQTIDWEMWSTKTSKDISLASKKIAVLIDRQTASAAEIIAAGLKDGKKLANLDSVVLIGDTTFGKGMGQIVVSRNHLKKRDIKITYLLLKGISQRTGNYHRKGIAPDILSNPNNSNQIILTALRILESVNILNKTIDFSLSKKPALGAYIRIDPNMEFE
jgi:hypothetical protein